MKLKKLSNAELEIMCINYTADKRKSLPKVKAEIQRRIDSLQNTLNTANDWWDEA